MIGTRLFLLLERNNLAIVHKKNRDSPGVAELNLRHQGNPYLSLDGAGPSGVISVPGLPKCASIGRVRVARGSNLSIFRP